MTKMPFRKNLKEKFGHIKKKIDYLNSLDAYPRTSYSGALRYQHRVLGTSDEAEIVGSGTKVSANHASIEIEIVVAWEAKYSGGGNKAMHEGNAPEFIISKTRDGFERYK
mgnify:CR=1 FL=1